MMEQGKKYELTENKKYFIPENETIIKNKEICAGYALGYSDSSYGWDGYCVTVEAIELTQIRALRDIPEVGVKKGDLGGWIQTGSFSSASEEWTKEKKEILSQKGNCWLDQDSKAVNSTIKGNAKIESSQILSSTIAEDATIKRSRIEDSRIAGNANVRWSKLNNSNITIKAKESEPYFIENEENCIRLTSEKEAREYFGQDVKIEEKKATTKSKPKVNLKPAKKKAAKSNDMER